MGAKGGQILAEVKAGAVKDFCLPRIPLPFPKVKRIASRQLLRMIKGALQDSGALCNVNKP